MVILDEGVAEILPTVDGADRECLESVESLAAHHHPEVGCHDVVVAICSLDGDGIDAHPHLGIRLAIVFLDADWFIGCGTLDGPESVGEGGEAVEVVTWLEVSDAVSQS